jgi:thiamine thiazole synthase
MRRRIAVVTCMGRSFGGRFKSSAAAIDESVGVHNFFSSKKLTPVPEHFQWVSQSVITRIMAERYSEQIKDVTRSDIIVAGAGVSGLCCAYELSKHPDVQVSVFEKSLALGGSSWIGAQNMGSMILRKPSHHMLYELDIDFEDHENFVVIRHAAALVSTLIAKICQSKSVRIMNGTSIREISLRGDEVRGVMASYTSNTSSSSPLFFGTSVLVSCCGTVDLAGSLALRRLNSMGWTNPIELAIYDNFFNRPFDMNFVEDAIVHHTREVSPGLVIAGSEIAFLDCTGQAGPTNGSTMQSGVKAAHLALERLKIVKQLEKDAPDAMETASHFIGSRV